MRPDVKLGVATSLVVVLVAGGYYLYRDRGEGSIPVRDESVALNDANADKTPAASTVPKEEPGKRASPLKRSRSRPNADTKSPVSRGRSADRTRPQSATTEPSKPTVTPERSAEPARTSESKDQPEPTAPNQRGPRTPAIEGPQSRGDARSPDDALSGVETVATTGGANSEMSPISTAGSADESRRRPAATRLAAGTVPEVVSPSSSQPSPQTFAMPSTPSVAVETHRAQPGDTFASLALAYYGSEAHTPFLVEQNPHITDPHRIRIGELIHLPPLGSGSTAAARPTRALSTAAAPTPSVVEDRKPRTYEVKSGDSFYGVARDVLGDSSRWRELFDLNKDAVHGDPKRLQVGQVIVLPQA